MLLLQNLYIYPMFKLSKKPFYFDVYWKSVLMLGPSQMWFFTLANDFYFNNGKNKFLIIGVYSLMIIPSLWFLKEFNYFNDLNNKSWFSLIKLFGLNFIFFLLSEMFHWKLLKNNFEEYDKLNGEYHEKITLMSVIFPLSIVFVVYQIITNIFTLL